VIIVLSRDASAKALLAVVERTRECGLSPHVVDGERSVVVCSGEPIHRDRLKSLSRMAEVERIISLEEPYELASKAGHYNPTKVELTRQVVVGSKLFTVIAGPCAVESDEQLLHTARAVKRAGAHALRGGAFKPRTSRKSFSGLGEDGLRLLAEAKRETGLPIVSEVLDVRLIDAHIRYSDVLQIGARSMQNYPLLKEVGQAGKPVLLKRGFMSTVEELLMAAEYVLAAGGKDLILCERGIRTFESSTRNSLDITAIPVLKERTHLPVIVDPSHASGVARYVPALARAAAAVGADGIMVEVHHQPDMALSDGQQSLNLEEFTSMLSALAPVASAVGRVLDAEKQLVRAA